MPVLQCFFLNQLDPVVPLGLTGIVHSTSCLEIAPSGPTELITEQGLQCVPGNVELAF